MTLGEGVYLTNAQDQAFLLRGASAGHQSRKRNRLLERLKAAKVTASFPPRLKGLAFGENGSVLEASWN